jgi:phage shock protein PspC (stress-responsive transcriptional regulator)
MWAFIISGALYLVGVAVALVVKPSFMFAPDGTWKEFGIGQDPKRYTVFPFWLFCLVWAVIAYIIVLLILPLMTDMEQLNSEPVYTPKNNVNKRSKKNVVVEDSDLVFDDEMEPVGLPKGYYVLNKKASRIAGTPKYVYLGEEEP